MPWLLRFFEAIDSVLNSIAHAFDLKDALEEIGPHAIAGKTVRESSR